ncbi:MAG: hypothetical protein ACT6RL_11300 [Neoaquamicrobium sediminum]|uniref:hypothetical protein n=1 Tax=Neoaquamicrobium sediminum TaxID=1849104 RepID=UPI00403713C8
MTDNSRSSAEIVPIAGRDAAGRFAAGNPGRAPGSRNRVSNEALQAVRSMKDLAIEQLRTRLENNDWQAVLFVLERTLAKGRVLEIDATSPAAITDALSTGQLTTEEAKNLATVLEKLASIEEINELRQRLDKLEAIANARR